MPLIRIEFDDAHVSAEDVTRLSKGIRDIVASETQIDDVFVYANAAQIKVQIAPIEIFIEMSAPKIKDIDHLMEQLKDRITNWKKENRFTIPINLSLIPMTWKVEIGL